MDPDRQGPAQHSFGPSAWVMITENLVTSLYLDKYCVDTMGETLPQRRCASANWSTGLHILWPGHIDADRQNARVGPRRLQVLRGGAREGL